LTLELPVLEPIDLALQTIGVWIEHRQLHAPSDADGSEYLDEREHLRQAIAHRVLVGSATFHALQRVQVGLKSLPLGLERQRRKCLKGRSATGIARFGRVCKATEPVDEGRATGEPDVDLLDPPPASRSSYL